MLQIYFVSIKNYTPISIRDIRISKRYEFDQKLSFYRIRIL